VYEIQKWATKSLNVGIPEEERIGLDSMMRPPRMVPMSRRLSLCFFCGFIAWIAFFALAQAPDAAIVKQEEAPFVGDLDQIRARGELRVLVSYSRTNFFISEGRPAGFRAI
jgi:hypothetical protein